MPRVLHLCRFQFQDQDVRRVGNVVDGGTSISGISDVVETDGGGFWKGEYTNGSTRTADDGKAWRGLVDYLDGGTVGVDVLFCERLFQPEPVGVSDHRFCGPLIDPAEFGDTSPSYMVAANAPLRATSLSLTLDANALPLSGGEVFGIEHPTWGWRVYRVQPVFDDGPISFRPPLREAVTAGTRLDFDNPRCRMRLADAASNPTNMGRFTTCALTLVEDMRKPS